MKQQLEPQYDKELYSSALKDWCPEADVKITTFLGGGYSGASALLIDIERKQHAAKEAGEDLHSGLYVLKLDSHRPPEGQDADEAQRLSEAWAWSPEFAKKHMPPLKGRFRSGDRLALLYEVAGRSFTRLVRSDQLSLGPLEARVRTFSEALLTQFNAKPEVGHDETVGGVLHDWLGHRLAPEAQSAIRELAESMTGGRRAFVRSLHILANPVALVNQEVAKEPLKVRFRGMLHGDLHRENVFWDRPPESQEFWLIDFALARKGPLLFDHSYFELSLLLNHFIGADPARLLSLLGSFLHPPDQIGARFVAPADEGIRTIVSALRNGITRWQQAQQPLRADAVAEQWCLARVAAALNWVNKPLDPQARHLAFCYAAHAAKEYVEIFHPNIWQQWSKDAEAATTPGLTSTSATQASDTAWQILWTEMGAFSPSDYFLLLAGPLDESENLAALGLLPWSAVLDFDPDSDHSGLLKCARPNLEQERSLHFFGKQVTPISFARGTA
ncbi:MAG: phosphotransferase [Verrucomicrobiota bacterium]|jgi:hypothetical protein